jgi:peroxiredoxin Q/BCP
MTTLKKGDKAPDFSGLDQDGNAHKLDYKGKISCFFIQKQVQVARPVILEIILNV